MQRKEKTDASVPTRPESYEEFLHRQESDSILKWIVLAALTFGVVIGAVAAHAEKLMRWGVL